MKKLCTLLLLISSICSYSQEKKTAVSDTKNIETKGTSLKFSSNSVKELESIEWNDLKSVFESNNEDEIVNLIFEIDLNESENKFKGSFTVSGKTKNIDALIVKAKKMVKGLINIAKNYKNN
ncbi:hypothetical protein [Polaribacter sp. IC073]|uniref:hypothetical protein n=1 Tax=Polaribacter sp. IC073 TaxID=2508540 RepID=UPI0011BE741C|nr:hypothetical protein [Polaribacter sp. IC073]TXD46394.1 hypothetical protein ES045_14420 [Polaribacter sp. IC073]